ncbi:hypothetical protein [Methanospirillum hungatei]|jgi:hypothetical protein|uniref:hypothetical protein n=1 Tax=Methanospirillum hungatei TaxID=2203 RepID=UPI001B6A1110|nr:hypothetical protein [Methanospirillum hungatei]MBP7034433.1 nitroreductase family protein [Methanospirillum sp.]HOW04092.1 nitroreductase family protein [Methanospirillum hungatei]
MIPYDDVPMKSSEHPHILCKPVYVFSARVPSDPVLHQVIHAGFQAPYPYPEPVLPNLRRFFVFRTGTPSCDNLEEVLKRAIETTRDELISFFGWRAYTPEGPGNYIQMLKNFETTGISSFKSAPIIIIITEERRFPPVEQESLAFAVSHLWISATFHHLGVHLIPGISYLSRRSEFFSLIHLPAGKYAVAGVAIGYPHEELQENTESPAGEPEVYWFF